MDRSSKKCRDKKSMCGVIVNREKKRDKKDKNVQMEEWGNISRDY